MRSRPFLPLAIVCWLASPGRGRAPADDSLLLRMPTVSADAIAFVYAGDLWLVPRTGGEARRLTSALGLETNPRFSPDGRWIAFSANYGGNADVYVIAAEGGATRCRSTSGAAAWASWWGNAPGAGSSASGTTPC